MRREPLASGERRIRWEIWRGGPSAWVYLPASAALTSLEIVVKSCWRLKPLAGFQLLIGWPRRPSNGAGCSSGGAKKSAVSRSIVIGIAPFISHRPFTQSRCAGCLYAKSSERQSEAGRFAGRIRSAFLLSRHLLSRDLGKRLLARRVSLAGAEYGLLLGSIRPKELTPRDISCSVVARITPFATLHFKQRKNSEWPRIDHPDRERRHRP